jgi:hypothetical protein
MGKPLGSFGPDSEPQRPSFSFVHGDDFGLFLVTSDPSAHAWHVLIQRPGAPPVSAERMPGDSWLHPYRPLKPDETCWDVGLEPFEPPGTTVIIEIPGSRSPLVVPHRGAAPAT